MNVLGEPIAELLGRDNDPIELLEERTRRAFGQPVLLWEGDPQTFRFSYVSPSAERLLGWPRTRWTQEPTFWADHVIAPDDRGEAVAYCALATGRRADHVFEYRARTADGRIVWLRDFVHVVPGARGVPRLLRGLMLDVTAEKLAQACPALDEPRPSLDELRGL